jgi:Xaa-Pro aminopeptidase
MRLAGEKVKGRIDGLLITSPEDVAYLSGFTGEDSVLLIDRDGGGALITDGRYDEQARAECGDLEVVTRTGRMLTAIAEWVAARKTRRLGLQGEDIKAWSASQLTEGLGDRRTVVVGPMGKELRSVKDDVEIAATRKAIAVAERAMEELLSLGRSWMVGRSEREVAAELDYRMRLAGASSPSFETIVAAGAHGSRPHYRPDGTVIEADQAVLIDWGAKVEGYCSDLTRVVFTGRIPPEIEEIYTIVRRARQAGIDAIRSGVSGGTVHAAARKVIAEAGYGERFVHGLGHGLGREIHELPVLSSGVKTRLRSGMIVTVEPGIYLPGVGGVRIEDDVLVTPRGPEKLTSLTTDLSEMVLS